MARSAPLSPTADSDDSPEDSRSLTRPLSQWPEQAQPLDSRQLDSRQVASAVSSFDPRAEDRRLQQQLAAARLSLCQPATSLRLVLAVQAAVALAVAGASAGWTAALLQWPGPALAALGASLLWLAVVCGWRERLARQPESRVRGWLVAWGAAAALLGWSLLLPFGLAQPAVWPAGVAAVCGAVAAGLVWAWSGWRQAAELPAASGARLAELQSRIRPHFLFNALNTALALVQVDPTRAEGVLEDLSALFRAALAETASAVTLDDELELAQRYLGIERVRFAHRLGLVWDLDPQASGARLPPLVLQPLVENAVRHGIEPAPLGGTVWVHTRVKGGMVEIEVINTLADSPGEPGAGIALANVRERLRLLHDLAGGLQTWFDGGKHHARITVPLA